jgi:hypothetical protein
MDAGFSSIERAVLEKSDGELMDLGRAMQLADDLRVPGEDPRVQPK